jgi:hypothetical protein
LHFRGGLEAIDLRKEKRLFSVKPQKTANLRTWLRKKKARKPRFTSYFRLAGAGGFEPPNTDTKNRYVAYSSVPAGPLLCLFVRVLRNFHIGMYQAVPPDFTPSGGNSVELLKAAPTPLTAIIHQPALHADLDDQSPTFSKLTAFSYRDRVMGFG